MTGREHAPLEPMTARRIETAGGARIEPPLDRRWSEEDQIRWLLGALLADTGAVLRVTAIRKPHLPTRFMVGCGRSGLSDTGFVGTWFELKLLAIGWREAMNCKIPTKRENGSHDNT